MVNKIHFGKRMSVLRRKAGLSQTDLAEKLGVTSQAVSKWECGISYIDTALIPTPFPIRTANKQFSAADGTRYGVC